MLWFVKGLVRLLSYLVPQSHRAEWREEWQAELHYRAHSSRARPSELLVRALGAVPDALHLLRYEWSVDVISQDIRHAFRMLRKRPGFSAVVIATLALGIGANTAMFGLLHGVLLKPLAFEEPERLMRVYEVHPNGGRWTFSPANLISFREEASLFDDIVGYGGTSLTLTGYGEPERVTALQVSAGFFDLLGTPLARGRSFVADDDQADAAPVVVISDGFWNRRFGRDESIVGKTITLNGELSTIVGVTTPEFRIRSTARDIYFPWRFSENDRARRGAHWIPVLGRLKADVELPAAVSELAAVARRLSETYPETNDGWSATARPLREHLVSSARTPLLVLFGAVGLVLLIACVNVANLLLARAESRNREMSLRTALGAGRGRLLKQLLTESVMFALLGGAIGLALAYGSLDLLKSGLANSLPRVEDIEINGFILLFTFTISTLAGLLVGILPAFHGARADLMAALKESGRQALTSAHGRRIRGALVVAEMALSLVLVTGAALLIKSFVRLSQVDPGFRAHGILTGRVSLPSFGYDRDDAGTERATFFRDLIGQLQSVPGVTSAAAIGLLPSSGADQSTTITVPGRHEDEYSGIEFRQITPGYFKTMGIPLLSGREIDGRDVPDSPGVIMVNEAFAERLFPNENPVGKRISTGWDSHPETLDIVGVVGNVKEFGLRPDAVSTMYWSHGQLNSRRSMSFVVRTERDPLTLVPAIRQAVWRLDSDLPISRIATMRQLVSDSVASDRMSTLLLGAFAAVALLLGAVGVYGVMSYTVTQRTQEVGVRMALGAGKGEVLGLIIRQGMIAALIGIGIGVGGALVLNRVLSSLLFDVSPTDPATLILVVFLLAAVAVAACYLPARRAASVDPLEALRYE